MQGQLRSQLLAQLQRNRVVNFDSQHQQHPPDLRRRLLNSVIAEYFVAARLEYSLSVFAEEAGSGNLSKLSDEEVMGVLRIDEGSALQVRFC